MPLLKIKLLSDDSASDLAAAIAAYQAGVGTPAISDQRGQDMRAFLDKSAGKTQLVAAIAHDGTDMPASKTADQQFLVVEADTVAAAQVALDAALAGAVHHRRADGDANTNAGDINVGAAMFAAGDVGTRNVRIGTQVRAIAAFTSATRVTYSGAAITGTGLVVELLGAESLQAVDIDAFKSDDGDLHLVVMAAVEGQIA